MASASLEQSSITLKVLNLQPGERKQNGYIERFNRMYREAVLDTYLFFDLYEVRKLTEEWIEEYNERRPHESLDNLTPVEWSIKSLNNENQQSKTV
jgi:putative transposase